MVYFKAKFYWNLPYIAIMIDLVGGFNLPLLKNMSSSVGMMKFPIYGEINKKYSKPPTSLEIPGLLDVNLWCPQ